MSRSIRRLAPIAFLIVAAGCGDDAFVSLTPSLPAAHLAIGFGGVDYRRQGIFISGAVPIVLWGEVRDSVDRAIAGASRVRFASRDASGLSIDSTDVVTVARSGLFWVVGSATVGQRTVTDSVQVVVACPASLIFGISLSVRDSVSGAPALAGSTTVVRRVATGATIDSVAVPVTADAGAFSLGLAGEQRGMLSVTVAKAGYHDWSRTVEVTGDVCHVRTVQLTALLQR